ncbi:G-type lectin S-receptor-like serine/threonine-protein kinase At1g11300 [Juglans regia]|uniref:non-specific serine/threonine protein kinase n=1 Tax=Juglans regia TaxID=51240 RepID=A0A6P9EIC6_JUGRE|nr:G-type lectin S-receptor-like serine/threonine-protein kinase At1g11300 [Juglans regia]
MNDDDDDDDYDDDDEEFVEQLNSIDWLNGCVRRTPLECNDGDGFRKYSDSEKRRILDWGTRVRVIEGIAQGLLYLHQYSRLRIIHRDLKASNILLDIDMNTKISDLGMARIFGGNESQANTNRIVGTYGYMSPEYAIEGLFLVKSDVFSSGILFGLLCVQESAADRPTMSDVVVMLNSESADLPYPKQPTFLNVRSMVMANPVHRRQKEICSLNDATISDIEGR